MIYLSIDSVFYDLLGRFDASYTKKVLAEGIALLGDLWPYLVSGIIITTLLKLFISKKRLAFFLGKKQNLSIIMAAAIGVVSPLGSYVIIPVSAALFSIGVPLPALMALLISSPLINPNLFLLTAGAFGYPMAIMRLVSAFVLGVSAGYGVQLLYQKRLLQTNMSVVKEHSNFNPEFGIIDKSDINFRSFAHELYKMTRYISKYFFLAIFMAAGIKILISPQLVTGLFNDNNLLSVIVTTGAGVPFYVCGGAAIPIVQQLADLGLSKGAVLAFFISGPVSKLSNVIIMYSVFHIKILLLYLFSGVLGAFLIGTLFNVF